VEILKWNVKSGNLAKVEIGKFEWDLGFGKL
jgi:hypothetical protein